VEVVPRVASAVELAIGQATDDDLVLVTGSLYVVGEARTALVD
jgi:folylpolyglutamate synthase/dihydropteroate synthase